jgi:hypothetical protein
MPKKDADDPNLFAKSVLDQIVAKHDPEAVAETGKDPKKVASGLRGGAKGGHARAKRLSAKKRSAIAKKAVNTRWKKSA